MKLKDQKRKKENNDEEKEKLDELNEGMRRKLSKKIRICQIARKNIFEKSDIKQNRNSEIKNRLTRTRSQAVNKIKINEINMSKEDE